MSFFDKKVSAAFSLFSFAMVLIFLAIVFPAIPKQTPPAAIPPNPFKNGAGFKVIAVNHCVALLIP